MLKIICLPRLGMSHRYYPHPPGDCLRQIRMAITWYVWRGDIFRVPLSTQCMKRETEGCSLTHVEAKCRNLLINRLQIQGRIEGTITNWWLKRWKLYHPSANPPHLARIPRQLEYLRILATDTAFIVPQGQTETIKKNTYARYMKCFDTYCEGRHHPRECA